MWKSCSSFECIFFYLAPPFCLLFCKVMQAHSHSVMAMLKYVLALNLKVRHSLEGESGRKHFLTTLCLCAPQDEGGYSCSR